MNRPTAGILAALVAEGVFTLMLMAVRALRGLEPWTALRLPASFLIGPEAVRPEGFDAPDVLLGAVVHIGFAALIGLIFAALLPRLRLTPLVGGLGAGAVLYVFGFWLLPQLFREWLAPFWLPPTGRALQALAHTVYGLVLGFTYARLMGTNVLDRR